METKILCGAGLMINAFWGQQKSTWSYVSAPMMDLLHCYRLYLKKRLVIFYNKFFYSYMILVLIVVLSHFSDDFNSISIANVKMLNLLHGILLNYGFRIFKAKTKDLPMKQTSVHYKRYTLFWVWMNGSLPIPREPSNVVM